MQHNYIGTEHLLLGILSEPSGLELLSGLITTQGEAGTLTLDWAREETSRLIERGARPVNLSKLSLTVRAAKVIDNGFETIKQVGLRSINMSVQTLALLDEIDGTSAQVLDNLCVNYDAFRRDLQRRVFGS